MPLPGNSVKTKLEFGIHSARPLLLLPLMGMLPACSMKLSHPDGSVTYLGAVNIQEGHAADSPLIHSRRFGVMLDAGTTTNGLALGYDDRLLVKPPNDAITRIDYTPGTRALSYQSQ